MAAPNLLALSSAVGKTMTANLTSVANATILAGNTNQLYKVNSIIVCNIDGATGYDVTFSYFDGTNDRDFAYLVTVPAKSSLSLIDKPTTIYVEETGAIRGGASANNKLVALISYEVLS